MEICISGFQQPSRKARPRELSLSIRRSGFQKLGTTQLSRMFGVWGGPRASEAMPNLEPTCEKQSKALTTIGLTIHQKFYLVLDPPGWLTTCPLTAGPARYDLRDLP